MKIVLISSLYDVNGGGAGIVVRHLARGMSASGNQVTVVTIGRDSDYSILNEEGVNVYRFRPKNIYPFEEKDSRPVWQKILWQLFDIYNFHSINVIRRILEENAPDIVHIHKMRGFSSSVWAISSRLFPGRVIQTCHDYESMSPDGLLRGAIGKMVLEKQWPMLVYQVIRTQLSKGVSVVTAPSKFTLNRIIESGLFPSACSAVIPNTHGWSLDQLESFRRMVASYSMSEVRFLYLGRLEEEKGISVLCKAFSQALEGNSSIKLDVAGTGSIEAELRQQYANSSNINFLGLVEGKTKVDILARATAIIMPSMVEEVFGLTTIEAFAFGKPVIASRVGGLPELVSNDETGWLVEAGNIPALVDTILMVSKMPRSELSKMNDNCRLCSNSYSLAKIVAEFDSLYYQLAK